MENGRTHSMARRTKAEMMVEFDRLFEISSTAWEFQKDHAPAPLKHIYDHTPSKQQMLELVESGKVTLSQLIEGLHQDINDFSESITDWTGHNDPDAQEFLAYYRARHEGRDYFTDAGDPRKTAKRIFKRGTIANETEWYVIKAVMDNTDQTVFTQSECLQVADMMADFELSQSED